MIVRRMGLGIGILAVGTAMALVPLAPQAAWAKPGYCTQYGKANKAETKSETAIVSAIESGNWAAAKKALLSSVSSESGAEKAAIAQLHSAPSNVQRAGTKLLKFVSTEVKIIKTSTSATQFETSEESLAQSPTFTAATGVLANYFDAKCGITPTTAPTVPAT